MKKILVAVLLLGAVTQLSVAQNPYAYFTYQCPSGQILYFSLDANGRGAEVTWPNYSDGDYWYGYDKPTGRVEIPDTVSWTYEDNTGVTSTHYYPVFCVGQNCFNGCTGITTVVFPETITAFEPNAFAGCTSMDSIIMPTVPPEVFAGQPIGMSPDANFYIPCGTWQAYYDAHYNRIHTGTSYPKCLEPEAEGVSLTLLADDPEMGEVGFYTPGVIDYVRCDSVAMIYARHEYHYDFDHWSNGSTKANDTLYVTGHLTLTAYFTIGHHTVDVRSRNEEMGTVEGGGSFLYLDTIEIRAIPNPGYHFDYWSDGNTDNPRTMVVDRDYTLFAFFAEGDPIGIDEAQAEPQRIYATEGHIVVEGVGENEIRVFSVDGKRVANKNLRPGVYMVQVGTQAARKVVL